MTRINILRTTPIRITAFRVNPATMDSVAWGKINFGTTASPLVFAAILIACSLAVGCSSEKPKPQNSTSQPTTQSMQPAVTSPSSAPATPALQASAKPAHKKVVRRATATVTYADKTTGLSFQYPRKYALKTGDAADELVSSGPTPMDFVQPGGVALAAVAIPESAYPKSDLASAFFNVSMNKSLTAEQCGEFSVPQAAPAGPTDPAAQPTAEPSKPSRLMIGDMELQSSETAASQGAKEQASKYYHVFENGSCYEFALQVATTGGETDEGAKHVDRDEVFQRLEKILATVKISPPTATPEVTADGSRSAPTATTPAQ